MTFRPTPKPAQTPHKRRKGLRRRSGRREAFEAELAELRPEYEAKPCEFCTCPGHVLHHKLRRSQGGTNERSNLAWLCNSCHSWVHANPEMGYKLGWLIRNKT